MTDRKISFAAAAAAVASLLVACSGGVSLGGPKGSLPDGGGGIGTPLPDADASPLDASPPDGSPVNTGFDAATCSAYGETRCLNEGFDAGPGIDSGGGTMDVCLPCGQSAHFCPPDAGAGTLMWGGGGGTQCNNMISGSSCTNGACRCPSGTYVDAGGCAPLDAGPTACTYPVNLPGASCPVGTTCFFDKGACADGGGISFQGGSCSDAGAGTLSNAVSCVLLTPSQVLDTVIPDAGCLREDVQMSWADFAAGYPGASSVHAPTIFVGEWLTSGCETLCPNSGDAGVGIITYPSCRVSAVVGATDLTLSCVSGTCI